MKVENRFGSDGNSQDTKKAVDKLSSIAKNMSDNSDSFTMTLNQIIDSERNGLQDKINHLGKDNLVENDKMANFVDESLNAFEENIASGLSKLSSKSKQLYTSITETPEDITSPIKEKYNSFVEKAACKKNELVTKHNELKAKFKLNNKKEYKGIINYGFTGTCKIHQRADSIIYFNDDSDSKTYEIVSFEYEGPKYVQRSYTETKTNNKKKWVGRTIAGGLIAGPAGAIIGGVTGKSVGTSVGNTYYYEEEVYSNGLLTLRNCDDSQDLTLDISVLSKSAEVLKSMLENSNIRQTTSANSEHSIDAVAEIRKYKDLMDEGIITKDEFEIKKKQLLNL